MQSAIPDFWDYQNNRDLLFLEEFNLLQKRNKNSSAIMWAIYAVYDYYSIYSEMPFSDRVKLIEDSWLKEPDFFQKNEKKLQPVINRYKELQDSQSMRKMLITFLETVDKRREYLKTTVYNDSNAKTIENLILSTADVFEQEKKIQNILAERNEAVLKGAIQLSLLESGRLGTYE